MGNGWDFNIDVDPKNQPETDPMPHEILAKVKGSPIRHIEQLWDEIKKLKERVKELEKSRK